LELYDQHVSANHLDIGVGTGYFLDHCRFPTANPRLALLDLNRNSLNKSARHLDRYDPEIYPWNALELDQLDIESFDSVAMTNLLHCLPGTMKSKRTVFEHVKALLNPGGVVFGSTILYRGVKRGFWARYQMAVSNIMGIMCNKQDDPEALEQNLQQVFPASSVNIIGCEALFWART
jgi:2-polyprenyl-3-methyl-5-hydroxy-6-metoxy-1,4-benzoquinol methylase